LKKILKTNFSIRFDVQEINFSIKGRYTETTSRIGFGCPGIPTFAFEESRLYLSPNIGLPSSNAKFRRRVCQKPILEVVSV
jgi:hypothetical protein